MAKKLYSGDSFPSLSLNLAGGRQFSIPQDIDSKYLIAIFYRGHWWPYCRRQLAGMQKHKDELEALGAKIIAGSVDSADKVAEAAPDATFPIAVEITRDQVQSLGAWWGDMRGGIMQPAEFLIGKDGKVVHSMYASGPVGRMAAEDLVRQLTRFDMLEREKKD